MTNKPTNNYRTLINQISEAYNPNALFAILTINSKLYFTVSMKNAKLNFSVL